MGPKSLRRVPRVSGGASEESPEVPAAAASPCRSLISPMLPTPPGGAATSLPPEIKLAATAHLRDTVAALNLEETQEAEQLQQLRDRLEELAAEHRRVEPLVQRQRADATGATEQFERLSTERNRGQVEISLREEESAAVKFLQELVARSHVPGRDRDALLAVYATLGLGQLRHG